MKLIFAVLLLLFIKPIFWMLKIFWNLLSIVFHILFYRMIFKAIEYLFKLL